MKSVGEVHDYWRSPDDGDNRPEEYLEGEGRCELLLELLGMRVGRDGAILELGCNVGRNLNALARVGYENLTGIEISGRALDVGRAHFASLKGVELINGTLEEELVKLKKRGYDLVYSMAVLEHVHSESEAVFAQIARISGRYVVTIEDERYESWRHFPRNYRKVFEGLGMEQIEEKNCLGIDGLNSYFFARVFEKSA